MITSLFVIAMSIWGGVEKGVEGFFVALGMSILVAATVRYILSVILSALMDLSSRRNNGSTDQK